MRPRLLHLVCIIGFSSSARAPRGQLRGRVSSMARPITRVVHWNVFEDGLTDAPGNLGFPRGFEERFSRLLRHLSINGGKEAFYGFTQARDFTRFPPVAVLDSTMAFFSSLDLAYSAMYHSMGGEARFGSSAPGESPDLGNSFRTLFLRSALPEPSQKPGATNRWTTPDFEVELEKISPPAEVAQRVRDLRQSAFDPIRGSLGWDRSWIDGLLWKRKENVWQGKWMKDLSIFISGPAPDGPVAEALSRFMHVTRAGDAPETEIKSVLTAHLDENEQVQQLGSLTFQSAVRWLLLQLCQHSLKNVDTASAICDFAGVTEAPSSAEDRLMLILPEVLRTIEAWFSDASLPCRHAKVCRHIEHVKPEIVTLVEYDGQWRRLGHPARYDMITGKGTAAILFDSARFEHLNGLDGIAIAGTIPAIESQLDANSDGKLHQIAPKSSCVALLRSREDFTLLLVTAIHLESAPPSDSVKVNLRMVQLRAVQVYLNEISGALASMGHRAVIILGGDFNALAEEFLHGNSDAFWHAAGVLAVQPPLQRPADGAAVVKPPEPPLVRFAEGGGLKFLCHGVDGEELHHASYLPEISCTRAGKLMVIDYLFVGTVGGLAVSSKPLAMATAAESLEAADEDFGIYRAVVRWGSDHLPVAAEIMGSDETFSKRKRTM